MIARRVYGEPGTLYARCGGVFGVSAFVDRCMDKWMACKTLNDNAMVARWHQSAQRPGFKFLVVQIVCSLTGGPQQYTGRPMDQAHKHLNISEDEWDVFMEIFNEVPLSIPRLAASPLFSPLPDPAIPCHAILRPLDHPLLSSRHASIPCRLLPYTLP